MPKRAQLLVSFLIASGCGSAQGAPESGDYDRRVPPGEPRAELALRVDLEPSIDCEERFDLALYEDRSIDVIRWDDGHEGCIDRQVTIVFLSQKVDKAKLLDQIRKLARKVSE